MNALEDAYNNSGVAPTGRVTKIDILRSASQHTSSLEEQLKEAKAIRHKKDVENSTERNATPYFQQTGKPGNYQRLLDNLSGQQTPVLGSGHLDPWTHHVEQVGVQPVQLPVLMPVWNPPDIMGTGLWRPVVRDLRGEEGLGWCPTVPTSILPPPNITLVGRDQTHSHRDRQTARGPEVHKEVSARPWTHGEWRWPGTINWPVGVWSNPLPLQPTSQDTLAEPVVRMEPVTEEVKEGQNNLVVSRQEIVETTEPTWPPSPGQLLAPPEGYEDENKNQHGRVNVARWLTNSTTQLDFVNLDQLGRSITQPIVIDADPTRSAYRTWPTVNLVEEDKEYGEGAVHLPEFTKVRHEVEDKDKRTKKVIRDPRLLKMLKHQTEKQSPQSLTTRVVNAERVMEDKMKDLSSRVLGLPSADTSNPLTKHQSTIATHMQTVIDKLKVEVADKEKTIQDLLKNLKKPDVPALEAPTGLLSARDPVLATLSYGEYVEPEDLKIEPNTGSETMEEVNMDLDVRESEQLGLTSRRDFLGPISGTPMEPLPGQELLDHSYVKLDVSRDDHKHDTMDDDSADWPDIRPLRIDLSRSKAEDKLDLHILKEPSNQGEYVGDLDSGILMQPDEPNQGEYHPQDDRQHKGSHQGEMGKKKKNGRKAPFDRRETTRDKYKPSSTKSTREVPERDLDLPNTKRNSEVRSNSLSIVKKNQTEENRVTIDRHRWKSTETSSKLCIKPRPKNEIELLEKEARTRRSGWDNVTKKIKRKRKLGEIPKKEEDKIKLSCLNQEKANGRPSNIGII